MDGWRLGESKGGCRVFCSLLVEITGINQIQEEGKESLMKHMKIKQEL